MGETSLGARAGLAGAVFAAELTEEATACRRRRGIAT